MKILFLLSIVATVALAQQYTTPVPILKQINRQNEDGSYSYGYEGADGSFKIETKYANGEVQGKYGYVDDSGKVREVEYGASRRGFEPQGTDINVPPPTLNNNNNIPYPSLGPNDEDDGQYREDPSIYYKDSKYNIKPASAPAYKAPVYNQNQNQNYNAGPRQYFQHNFITEAPQRAYQPQPQQQQQQQEYYQQPQQHRFNSQHQQFFQDNKFQSQPQQQQQQQYYQPQQQRYQSNDNLIGHPATNLDLNTGSYSLSYTG